MPEGDDISDNILRQKLVELIANNGPIGIDVFMQFCLYDPQNGYYIKQSPIGSDGDFITAPEISQLFGEMIALWVISCWYNMGCPPEFDIIEIGAGRGTLLNDILRTIAKSSQINAKTNAHIIESNQTLIKTQTETLKEFGIKWHKDLGSIFENGQSKNFVLIGNEFLDCLPIKQFIKTDKGWCEKLIGINDNNDLIFGLSKPYEFEIQKTHKNNDIGAIIEISTPTQSFIENICEILKHNRGYALFIDYGYDDFENGDTLQSLYKHQKQSPLLNPGNADITAHVDFMEVARICDNHNIEYEGPISQGEFLGMMGIESRAAQLIAANPHEQENIKSGLNRLIDDQQMGKLFKVIALKNLES